MENKERIENFIKEYFELCQKYSFSAEYDDDTQTHIVDFCNGGPLISLAVTHDRFKEWLKEQNVCLVCGDVMGLH